MFPYIIQGTNVIIVVDGQSYTITSSHVAYNAIIKAIKEENADAVRELVNPKEVLLKYASGNVEIEGETFKWKGQPMHTVLSDKMIKMLAEGFSITPLVNFMHLLKKNPSNRAVTELYCFLEKAGLPITPDGHFLAYKKVRDDYMDCYSGTISNHVGAVVSMDRNEVDDNRDRTCSHGLHFCSQEYLEKFNGSRIMILKISPADVVSIPSDYNDSKGRCCHYQVIGELKGPVDAALTKAVMDNANGVVSQQPKEGNSNFYKGYSDGFAGVEPNSSASIDYQEGYIKGAKDIVRGFPRYNFVPPQDPPLANWPYPKGFIS
jgi:hypothetical protein